MALAYFGLTAPNPVNVGADVYNRYLFAPRAAGFLTVLLPLVLAVGGVFLVLAGTIFHLGARFFGARNWEGSVSIWCYAKSAGVVPLVAAEAAGCGICIVCYLVALAAPGARSAAASAAQISLLALGGAASLLSIILFFLAVFSGCTRSFKLPAERGAAAGLAGLLLLGVICAGVGIGVRKWGLKGGLIAVGSAALLIGILLVMHLASSGLSDAREAQT